MRGGGDPRLDRGKGGNVIHLHELATAARRLNRHAGADGLPHLFFLTDPTRTPDPGAIARRLPRGAALIYRHFGAPDRVSVARTLRRVTQRRGVLMLIGADLPLAAHIGADGVHLPERLHRLIATAKLGFPLVTAAAHDARAVRRAALLGADASLLSPVFPSRSASAGQPLGAAKARRIARAAPCPVIALGGVNVRTVGALQGRGFAGLAAIEGLLEAER